MSSHVLVLAAQPWAQEVYDDTLRWLGGFTWQRTSEPRELERLGDELVWRPDVILSLHWHWMIPAEVVNTIRCIGFHASDLPEFRGGNPISNQTSRGIVETKLTAFRLTEHLDAGPVYCKLPLSLSGSRQDIYERLKGLIARMVPPLLAGVYEATPQVRVGSFYRRGDVLAP